MDNFDINKYLGTWYELARYGVIYEKYCSQPTANYSLNKDGTVNIINECNGKYNRQAQGVAKEKFPGFNMGALKVSFFPGVWGAYNVLWTDYANLALVTDDNISSAWILSRTPDRYNEETVVKMVRHLNAKKLIWSIPPPKALLADYNARLVDM